MYFNRNFNCNSTVVHMQVPIKRTVTDDIDKSASVVE